MFGERSAGSIPAHPPGAIPRLLSIMEEVMYVVQHKNMPTRKYSSAEDVMKLFDRCMRHRRARTIRPNERHGSRDEWAYLVSGVDEEGYQFVRLPLPRFVAKHRHMSETRIPKTTD